MIILEGYQIYQKIYHSNQSQIYRAMYEKDNTPVILKVLAGSYPSPEKIAWFKREYQIIQRLNLPGVINVYQLLNLQQKWIMVMEDFGGDSLTQLNLKASLSNKDFLTLAIGTTTILGNIHEQHIMHKDINPDNIIYNPQTGQIKLIDFGISTILNQENPAVQPLNNLEGTLAYISPEQTGRLNQQIDYRTDFYALGVTLYELATGQLPFLHKDVLEIVHAHIAQHPPAPHEIKPSVPPMVSAIIMKLMAKHAEDRYQLAHGLKADLEVCLQQWQMKKSISYFKLGQYDLSNQFRISQRLYGRDKAFNTLLTTFKQINNKTNIYPRAAATFVTGPAGIGKTKLVQQLQQPIIEQGGYFIWGKFEQHQHHTPYAPLIQSFQILIQHLLTETEEQIMAWRRKLLAVLGDESQIIIDFIPEITLIIGVPPKLTSPSTNNAQARFNLVLKRFIKLFAQPEHPLVIFLDDLQWADQTALDLIKLILTTPATTHLYFIGAYQDDELNPQHSLTAIIADIKKSHTVVNHISLAPLDVPALTGLVSNSLSCPIIQATSLAKLIQRKTGGNPFFTHQFLKSLYQEQLITFSLPLAVDSNQQGVPLVMQGGWQWDLNRIQSHQITDNVAKLMTGEFKKLPPKTQIVLKLAACIGNQFDLSLLASVYKKSSSQTATDLWVALTMDLILPLGDAYKVANLDIEGLSDNLKIIYKFAHNQLQQAIYSLIPQSQREKTHWSIGQSLLQHLSPAKYEDRIFELVYHLNSGSIYLKADHEQQLLAKLNYLAGKKAQAAIAYQKAFNYFQLGLSYLTDASWEKFYRFTLNLHIHATETAYLSGNITEVDHLANLILEKTNTLLDQITAYEVKISAYFDKNDLLSAIETGLHALSLLDVHFPAEPSEADLKMSIEDVNQVIKNKPVADLVNLPEMTTPYELAKMRLLMSISVPAHLINRQLSNLTVLKRVILSICYGHAPSSAAAYAAYGLILIRNPGDITKGYEFGALAIALLRKQQDFTFKSRTLMIAAFIHHHKNHIRQTLPLLREAYNHSLETGNISFGRTLITMYITYTFFSSRSLSKLENELILYDETLNQADVLDQDTPQINVNNLFRQIIFNLKNITPSPGNLQGDYYNPSHMKQVYQQKHNYSAIFQLHCYQSMLHYLFRNYPQAIEKGKAARIHIDHVKGLIFEPGFYFYNSLIYLAVYPDSTSEEQDNILEIVRANQDKLRVWALHGPMNYAHKVELVQAELARVLGQAVAARENYYQAITQATKNGYVQDEALACELAAEFYLQEGSLHLGYYYLQEAHYAYERWGATAKSYDLHKRYPEAFTEMNNIYQPEGDIPIIHNFRQTTSDLDLKSVIKATQIISREIDLDKILNRLIKFVIQNAGAQRGCLILVKDNQLVIEAEGTIEGIITQTVQSLPIDSEMIENEEIDFESNDAQSSLISLEIVHYVARTRKSLVLENASRRGNFVHTPYIIKNQPKSILCTPLINQGELIGLIYLENNLLPNTFTPTQVEIVGLLGTQATISIVNSQTIAARTEQERLHLKNEFLEKQTHELAKLNADKDKFFSIVSHDLRSPFTTLLGSTDFMLESFDSLNGKEVYRLVKTLNRSAKAAYNLLENLLTWSRLQRGQLKHTVKRVELNPLAQNVVELFNQRATEKNISLENIIPSEIFVFVDQYMIETVIRNLTSNALKFTPKGGLVSLDIEPIEIENHTNSSSASQVNYVTVVVSDTGVGISAEDVAKLFKLETHHSTPGTDQEQGTGLGLIICREMVQQNGGKLWVESTLGKGTIMKFTLRFDSASWSIKHKTKSHDFNESTTPQNDTFLTGSSLPLVTTLPMEDIRLFKQLIKIGDLLGVEERANELKYQYEGLAPLAERLITLAQKFEETELLNLLEQLAHQDK